MIYEDPDELGYSTVPPSSLAVCNTIVPLGIQNAIEEAARYAHAGVRPFVTAWRKQAGYDDVAGYVPLGPLRPSPPLPPSHGGYPSA